jgi:flavin reductase (DIM6/NTAB) family NADH-FMN oxidoreductase RutF
MNFDKHDFRHCMGRFATGITVVSTINTQGKKCGMTINSFSSLSLEPPLILFSIDKNAHNHDSFATCKKFNVNILSDKQQQLSQSFAAPSGVKWDKINHSNDSNGIPTISECIAYIFCDMEQVYSGGDHSIIVGRVSDLITSSEEDPLLYFKGKYRKIGEEL